MRKEKERDKKKKKQSEIEKTLLKKEKIPSHPILQMQSVYGNRAIERIFKRKNEERQNENAVDNNIQNIDFVPIFRFPNSPQDGIRVYQSKEQFHYDHRLYIPKKQNQEDEEQVETDENDEKSDHLNKRTSSSSTQHRNKQDPTLRDPNAKAKEHFTNEMNRSNVSPLLNDDSNKENANEDESFNEFIHNKIKLGRFSFLNAYPILVSMIRQKNKETEKKKKGKKKSRISRMAQRFLGKV